MADSSDVIQGQKDGRRMWPILGNMLDWDRLMVNSTVWHICHSTITTQKICVVCQSMLNWYHFLVMYVGTLLARTGELVFGTVFE